MEIIKKIGIPAMLEQLGEEGAELCQASLKLARKLRGDNPTPKLERDCLGDLVEEIADVLLCIDLLVEAGLVSHEAIDSIMMQKRGRWNKRLENKPVRKYTAAEIAYAYTHFGIDLTITDGDVIKLDDIENGVESTVEFYSVAGELL